MGLVNYKDIDFNKSIKKENKIIDFNGTEIQIVPYLSMNDKYDLIMITLQKSFENGIYNSLKLDMYFDLNLVYMYSNILFTDEERADEVALYDKMRTSGLLNAVLREIPIEEHQFLITILHENEEKLTKYNNSFNGLITNFIEDISKKLEKGMDILKQIKPEKLQEILKNPQIAAAIGSVLDDKGNNNLN